MKYRNLTVIGTSHIAMQSMEEVERTVEKIKPDIIAVELDRKRLHALMHGEKRRLKLGDIRRIGIRGFIFNLVGAWVEKRLGKIVGVKPGSEMITAINMAKKYKLNIALVDQDIEVTLKKITKAIGLMFVLKLIWDLITSPFVGKKQLKKIGIKEIDLTKVPSKKVIRKLTRQVKKRYPKLYKVLVEERNEVIARNLCVLMKKFPDKKILAVIGAGHEEEVIALAKKNIGKIYKQ